MDMLSEHLGEARRALAGSPSSQLLKGLKDTAELVCNGVFINRVWAGMCLLSFRCADFNAKRQAHERKKSFLDARPNYRRAVEENKALHEGLEEAVDSTKAAKALQRSDVAKGSCMWMH